MLTWMLPAVLALSGVVAPPPPAHGTVLCRGEAAVLVDEAGDWVGSARRDVVAVINADAEVFGNDGDDLICVYPDGRHYSGATVHGGPGNDTIITYGGSNQISGDGGDDIVYLGGTGEDVEGGDGDDHVWALGASGVYVDGQAGGDMLQGSPATDHLSGGDGADLLIGAGGDDVLAGDDGNDTLMGGAGADTLGGGGGAGDRCEDGPGTAFGADCELVTVVKPLPISP